MRSAVLGAFGKIGDERALKPLLLALKDAQGRVTIVKSLVKLGDARALDALLPYANDTSSWLTQMHILSAFQRFKDPRCIPALITILENKESKAQVREQAECVMLYFLEQIPFKEKVTAARAFAAHNRIQCADCGEVFMWKQGWEYFAAHPLPGDKVVWKQGLIRGSSFACCPHCEAWVCVGESTWHLVGENASLNAGKARPIRRLPTDFPREI